MIETTIKAVVGMVIISCAWLTVQVAWRRVFANTSGANETGFNRCGCHADCQSICDEARAAVVERDQQLQHGSTPINQEV